MANRIGFRGFAKPSEVSEDLFRDKLSRLDADLYIFRTTSDYRFRKGSARGLILSLVKKRYTPIPLKKLASEARTAFGGDGYTPEFVRSAAYLQRNSLPAVYYLLRKREDGSFVAAADYPKSSVDPAYEPFAKYLKRGIRTGDVLLPAKVRAEEATSEEKPALEGPTSEEKPAATTE